MKLEIKNRWTSAVQFACELTAEIADKSYSVQLGFAVTTALAGYADLRDADLRDADLRGADLSDADLRGADLSDADLHGADLRGADLSDADLHGADLRGANLHGADLHGADLHGADLSDANLHGADLRSFKADLWMTLTENWHEVPALVTALREGRVNGSTYTGSCACLVGTIANAKGISYETLAHDSNNPAEQWFLMIKTGDTPGSDTGGGFACKKALEWTLEWCALNGVALPEVSA